MKEMFFVAYGKPYQREWFHSFAKGCPLSTRSFAEAMAFDYPEMAVIVQGTLVKMTGDAWEVVSLERILEETENAKSLLRSIFRED